MSENETKATEAKATEPEAKAPDTKPVPKLDEFGNQLAERLAADINLYNSLAAQVKAASGDPQALLETLRESSNDAEAAKYTAAIEDLDNKREQLFLKRDEILKPIVAKMVEDAKSGLGDSEAKAAELLKKANAGKKYLVETYGEGADSGLPAIVGKRRASSGGTGGSGQRRIRGFDVYVDGTLATGRNGKGEQVSNMAAAAKVLGVDTDDLRTAFWEAAGTDDSSKYPATVEFTITITEGEGDDAKPVTKTIVAKKVSDGEARATESAA